MSEVFMKYIALSIASILSVVAIVWPVVFKLKEWVKVLKEDKISAEVNAKLEIVSAENKEPVKQTNDSSNNLRGVDVLESSDCNSSTSTST